MKFVAAFLADEAIFPEPGLTGDSIPQAADKALWFFKNGGRDLVTIKI